MKRKGLTTGKGMSCVVVAAVLGTQLWDCGGRIAWADTLEWEGTTQISTSDQYTNLDTSTVSLVVEEVYEEAGAMHRRDRAS